MGRILLLELALLIRGRGVVLGVAALLIAGLAGLGHGLTVIDRQRAALDDAPRLQQEEHRRILGPLDPSANAGDQLYYLAFHTVREPSAWAPLAVGQRDVHAFNLKVRILALQGQLYDTDLGNPLLATLGQFDLAFVLVVLAPLLVIAFTFGAYSDEVTDGTWTLVTSQPTDPRRVLAIRYLLRAGAVWLALVVLYGVATIWLSLPLDGTWLADRAGDGGLCRSVDRGVDGGGRLPPLVGLQPARAARTGWCGPPWVRRWCTSPRRRATRYRKRWS